MSGEEDHTEILKAIGTYGRFSDTEISVFLDKVRSREISKNNYLLQPGEICQSIYFLLQGSLRMYWTDVDNDRHITELFVEGEWVLDRESFTSQKPSRHFIQAGENCRIEEILLCDLHEIIAKSPAFFSMGRIIYSDNHTYNGEHLLTPEEKYLDLLKNRPTVIQKFPLKQIASMIGITPETLSRIRRKIK